MNAPFCKENKKKTIEQRLGEAPEIKFCQRLKVYQRFHFLNLSVGGGGGFQGLGSLLKKG